MGGLCDQRSTGDMTSGRSSALCANNGNLSSSKQEAASARCDGDAPLFSTPCNGVNWCAIKPFVISPFAADQLLAVLSVISHG